VLGLFILIHCHQTVDYLGVECLLDALCALVPDSARLKAPEEAREFLGIHNDFTASEESELKEVMN
jgi:hypothetical protein